VVSKPVMMVRIPLPVKIRPAAFTMRINAAHYRWSGQLADSANTYST
jgi:hypothetical protein